ncbi:hypothetical protein C2G38_2115744 [Gigaspora rosea]|uniref:Uncharacterized protein n=1 Tax=Gigaspora rosea TaxID=44941 RepID=A0A397U8U1_9GLOM|nr:hypothetical protein C2G38_2115744 [Gigaspora rosea]
MMSKYVKLLKFIVTVSCLIIIKNFLVLKYPDFYRLLYIYYEAVLYGILPLVFYASFLLF